MKVGSTIYTRAVCRLLGFRSVVVGNVQQSLVAAENALAVQSRKHPDGWGVAYYVDGVPHVLRRGAEASTDVSFLKVGGAAESKTVLAHVRRATVGKNNMLNCHPFQFGRWVFAHNGDIPNFDQVRPSFLEHVDPRFHGSILGDTDSEILFYLFLTQLGGLPEGREETASHIAMAAMRRTVEIAREITDGREGTPTFLTMIATDGRTMVAVQGGKELSWSTFKTTCPERADCPSLASECENPTATGFVTHLVLSSEEIKGPSIWIPLDEHEIIAVDARMQLARSRVFEDEFDDGGTQPYHPLAPRQTSETEDVQTADLVQLRKPN